MIAEQELLTQLLQSPRLPFFVQDFSSRLASEAQQRSLFYAQVQEDEKAEFINGEIIMHSPVRLQHNAATGNIFRLLSTYVLTHQLGYVGHEKIMVALTRNDYEPDVCYFGPAKAATFTPDQVLFPAPDLVVEVLSDSTAANDRGVKFEDYAAHGVVEYWIVDSVAEVVEQYLLEGDSYILSIKARSGELSSLALPGFVIPVRAIFDQSTPPPHLAGLAR